MKSSSLKTKLLHIVWSIFPWLLVVGIVAFLFFLGERIQLEKTRLGKAKQAAIKIDTVPVSVITQPDTGSSTPAVRSPLPSTSSYL